MAVPNRAFAVRKIRRALLAVVALGVVGISTGYWVNGHRVQIRAALDVVTGHGFAPVAAFALRDSLPDLEGGLSNLEAFKVTISPLGRANPERSVWLSDSVRTVNLEFVSDKRPFDSVVLLTWLTGDTLRRSVSRVPEATWNPTLGRAVDDWVEVVSVYASFPPLFNFRSNDSAISLFTQAEGMVFHVVGGWYLSRKEVVLESDTAYRIAARGDDAQLMVKGDALAFVNPSSRPITMRIIGEGDSRGVIVRTDSTSVSVYRTLMKKLRPPALAYSEPGITFPIFRRLDDPPRLFFVWPGDSRIDRGAPGIR
jgi:hypothetical protein